MKKRKRVVREMWETTIVASDSPYLHLYVPHKGKMYVTKGFMAGDRVRVTVEKLPRKEGK